MRELESVQKKLSGFVDQFRPLLGRSERCHWCGSYVSGLILDGERKSMQPMAERLGCDRQSLQQFISDSPWDSDAVLDKLIDVNLAAVKPEGGVLLLDDTALPKKGDKSVGVARQYCGALGKISNCQSIVSWSLGLPHGHIPLLARLYLPKAWTEDSKRLDAAGVPAEHRAFKEKWRIALDLLARLKGKVPFEACVFDAGYGEIKEFLRELDCQGMPFVAQIPGSQSFWPQDVAIKGAQHMGRPRLGPIVADPDAKPLSAAAWAAKLMKRKGIWKTVQLRFDQSGKSVSAAAIRVRERDGPGTRRRAGAEWWLIIERYGDGSMKYYVSNLSGDTSLRRILRLAHQRWKVEQGYQQLKEELGLDHFEGRSWRGLHHHIATCFMAQSFLFQLKSRRSSKSVLDTAADAALAQ